jgi:hypothetical protein
LLESMDKMPNARLLEGRFMTDPAWAPPRAACGGGYPKAFGEEMNASGTSRARSATAEGLPVK